MICQHTLAHNDVVHIAIACKYRAILNILVCISKSFTYVCEWKT